MFVSAVFGASSNPATKIVHPTLWALFRVKHLPKDAFAIRYAHSDNNKNNINTNNTIINSNNTNSKITKNNGDTKASLDQLVKLEAILANHLPRFFIEPHPLKIYTQDVLLIDNIRGRRVQGLTKYGLHISLVKFYSLLRYNSVKLELLNLVKHPEESCIKIRWRVVTKPGLIRYLTLFGGFKSLGDWRDGISTMHVNKDGKIHCHVCDNIELDETGKEKQSIKNPFNLAQGLPT